jgi:hypothetical protein
MRAALLLAIVAAVVVAAQCDLAPEEQAQYDSDVDREERRLVGTVTRSATAVAGRASVSRVRLCLLSDAALSCCRCHH